LHPIALTAVPTDRSSCARTTSRRSTRRSRSSSAGTRHRLRMAGYPPGHSRPQRHCCSRLIGAVGLNRPARHRSALHAAACNHARQYSTLRAHRAHRAGLDECGTANLTSPRRVQPTSSCRLRLRRVTVTALPCAAAMPTRSNTHSWRTRTAAPSRCNATLRMRCIAFCAVRSRTRGWSPSSPRSTAGPARSGCSRLCGGCSRARGSRRRLPSSLRHSSCRRDQSDLVRIRSHVIRSYPIRSYPIRSDPIRSDPIRSDLIRSLRAHKAARAPESARSATLALLGFVC
jgi:hypothetical protein